MRPSATKVHFVIALVLFLIKDGAAFAPSTKFLSISNHPLHTSYFLAQKIKHSGKVPSFLHSTSDDTDEKSPKEEETLLCVNFSINNSAERDPALSAVRSYVRSFPFAAVLPVQPLTYLPTEDGKGVDVTFLRKKTKEKGSVDGGIKFTMDFTNVNEGDGNDEEENGRIQLVAKRNSEGQTISKIFSEKLVVQAFVAGISGERDDGNNLSGFVAVESIFHKWM